MKLNFDEIFCRDANVDMKFNFPKFRNLPTPEVFVLDFHS